MPVSTPGVVVVPWLTPRTSLQADDEAIARVHPILAEALAGDYLSQLRKAFNAR